MKSLLAALTVLATSAAFAADYDPRAQGGYADLAAQSAALSAEQRLEARRLFASGFDLWQAGDCTAATLAFGEGLKLDPANPQANYYHGDCLLKLRRRDEATEAFRRASTLGAGSTEGFKAQAALEDVSRPQSVAGLSAAQYEKIWLGDWELKISMRNFRSGELKIFKNNTEPQLSMTGNYQWQESFLSGTIEFANAIFRGDQIEFVSNASATGKFRGRLVSETEIRGSADWGSHGTANWIAIKKTPGPQ